MSVDRKKVKPKALKKAEPKKRPAGAKKIKLPKVEKSKTKVEEAINPNQYVKVSIGDKEKFKIVGDRVQLGELKWSYFSSDGENGVHYYIKT